MSKAFSRRVRGVGKETLDELGPFQVIPASDCSNASVSFKEAMGDVVNAIRSEAMKISSPNRQNEVISQIEIATMEAYKVAEEIKKN
jgi:hypothetical protein